MTDQQIHLVFMEQQKKSMNQDHIEEPGSGLRGGREHKDQTTPKVTGDGQEILGKTEVTSAKNTK